MRAVVALGIVALLVGACSRGREEPAANASPLADPTPPPTPSPRLLWPPVVGQEYPDLPMRDRAGNIVRLASFRGRVILIEPIGMTCPAGQAFCGAHRKGPLGAVKPQPDLLSIEEYFAKYTGGVSLSHPRLAYIQLLLYDAAMATPKPADVAAWAEHFGHAQVYAGGPELLGTDSFNMIPGFQLVDRAFVLRYDSTGSRPRHNLYTELLPQVALLMSE